MEDGAVAGVVFESKEGRLAIRARVTVDCTGDGDIFGRAGAGADTDIEERDIHHCMNTSWIWGGVDMTRWIAFKTGDAAGFSAFMERGRSLCGGLFERPFVSWRNDVALFMGPRLSGYSAVDIQDLTEVEIRSHRLMAQHLEVYRAHAPGFEQAFLMLSAPQLGVRHSRRLPGVARVTRERWSDATPWDDEIGVSPSLSPKLPPVSVPYGCLVPRAVDGLLVAGRHVSCDAASHSFLREIPQCWLTGQAAGAAAGVAVRCGVMPRAVPVGEVQAELVRQGALLRAGQADLMRRARCQLKWMCEGAMAYATEPLVIESTAGELAAELARAGLRRISAVTVTIEADEPADWITKAEQFARPKVIEAGWSVDDIDRLIKQAQREAASGQ